MYHRSFIAPQSKLYPVKICPAKGCPDRRSCRQLASASALLAQVMAGVMTSQRFSSPLSHEILQLFEFNFEISKHR